MFHKVQKETTESSLVDVLAAKTTPDEGIEPSTTRLKVGRSTD
jgi:hypothetical protein